MADIYIAVDSVLDTIQNAGKVVPHVNQSVWFKKVGGAWLKYNTKPSGTLASPVDMIALITSFSEKDIYIPKVNSIALNDAVSGAMATFYYVQSGSTKLWKCGRPN